MSVDVLIVDDEKDIQTLIAEGLSAEFTPKFASNSEEVFAQINKKVPGIIILDIWLQGSTLDGLGILEKVKERYPHLPVIIISGHGTIQTAVSAIKKGAYDYIEKPFTHEKLAIVLNRAYETLKLKIDNNQLRSRVIEPIQLVGRSQPMIRLRNEVERIAKTNSRVMLSGGIGSGKELVARMIHKRSKFTEGPFISFSATGLSQERIMQELFGDENKQNNLSIFTKRNSVLETAQGGTLYLDKVEELPLAVQARLLRVLQDPGAEGLNSKLEIRLISSTACDLEEQIRKGKFREDLYYRLNVVPLKIPSLAERRDDIPVLVEFLVKQSSKVFGIKPVEFAQDTIALLQAYNWPGNIIQLKSVVEWALIMSSGVADSASSDNIKIVTPDMLPNDISNNNTNTGSTFLNLAAISLPLREARRWFEQEYLTWHIKHLGQNISKTSEQIGMERSALHRKIKDLGISPRSNKRSKTL